MASPLGHAVVCLLFVIAACMTRTAVATSSCPELDAYMNTCVFNRTDVIGRLYYALAAPGDSSHCTTRARLYRAYDLLASLPIKSSYGSTFDTTIFVSCDWLSDGRYCAVDVTNTRCTCVNTCDQVAAIKQLLDTILQYPNWETTGVPWNNYRV